MAKRLDILKKWVDYCLNLKPEQFENKEQILIKHLFYDEYDVTNMDFEKIRNEDIEKMLSV